MAQAVNNGDRTDHPGTVRRVPQPGAGPHPRQRQLVKKVSIPATMAIAADRTGQTSCSRPGRSVLLPERFADLIIRWSRAPTIAVREESHLLATRHATSQPSMGERLAAGGFTV
jgi:hypothetical protein